MIIKFLLSVSFLAITLCLMLSYFDVLTK